MSQADRNSLWNQLEREAVKMPGVNAFPSQFNPVPALWFNGREFAAFHDGEIALSISKTTIKSLESAGAMAGHRPSTSRDWVWMSLRNKADVQRALRVIGAVVVAKREKGEPSRPMPDEKTLARRRRLHRQPIHDLDV